MAVLAHQQKRNFISTLMASPDMPLWEIGKTAADGRPYVDLDAATYIIGLVGLNECVQGVDAGLSAAAAGASLPLNSTVILWAASSLGSARPPGAPGPG